MSGLTDCVEKIIDESEDLYVIKYFDKDEVQIPTMKCKKSFLDKSYQSSNQDFSSQLKGNAYFYLYSAEILERERPKNDNLKVQELSPIGALLSFCCELFLKWLIFCEKNDRNECTGHALKDLYKKLSPNLRAKIINAERMSDFNFELLITQHNEVFECIRYIHEHKLTSFNYQFLLQFARTLKEICYEGI